MGRRSANASASRTTGAHELAPGGKARDSAHRFSDEARRACRLVDRRALSRAEPRAREDRLKKRNSKPVLCQNSIMRLDEELLASDAEGQMPLVLALLGAMRAALRTRAALALENLALRQQLALLRRRSTRPRFGLLDRAFWVWLSRRWSRWRETLHVVRPETVIRWHRQGFRAFWTWKSRRGRTGRQPSARSLPVSSVPWRARICFGVPPASMASYSSSGSKFRSAPLPGSCHVVGSSHPRKPGEHSSRTTSPTSSPSTSLSCRLRPSACSTCSWFCCIIAARSCTSM